MTTYNDIAAQVGGIRDLLQNELDSLRYGDDIGEDLDEIIGQLSDATDNLTQLCGTGRTLGDTPARAATGVRPMDAQRRVQATGYATARPGHMARQVSRW